MLAGRRSRLAAHLAAVAILLLIAGCVRAKPLREAPSPIAGQPIGVSPGAATPLPTMTPLTALPDPLVPSVAIPSVTPQPSATVVPTSVASPNAMRPTPAPFFTATPTPVEAPVETPPEPTATPAPTDTPPAERVHVVQPGETLYSIARRYESTVEAILARNDIASADHILIGQTLYIPSVPVEVETPTPTPPLPSLARHSLQPGETLTQLTRTYRTTLNQILQDNAEITDPNQVSAGTVVVVRVDSASYARTHIVRPGQTLFSIAQSYSMTVDALVRANRLAEAAHIEVDQVLVIP